MIYQSCVGNKNRGRGVKVVKETSKVTWRWWSRN